jgi:hypothetical protein
MEKFADITARRFGWSAQDQKIRLLLPEITTSIRARAATEMATRGTSKCKACGSLISKGMQRCVFKYLNDFGWSPPSFVHARAEDCTQVEIWDAHQVARFHAAKVGL